MKARGSFRAANDAGFMVDLIKPMPKDRLRDRSQARDDEDLQAVAIEGLTWLVNSPKHRVTVIDGLSARDHRARPKIICAPQGLAIGEERP